MAHQPVLFIGHGSPMNAIVENEYTQKISELGRSLDKPRSILCVSAHWMTQGSFITTATAPKQIYDMQGFPEELYQLQYSPPGDPQLAELVIKASRSPSIHSDQGAWGLDHGAWSTLVHLFPKADVPIVQLSLDMTQPLNYHFALGRELERLREMGVMILGSGNVVHNLRQIQWQSTAPPHPLASEFEQWVVDRVLQRDFASLFGEGLQTKAGQWSVPTLEHYLPLMYVLGAVNETDQIDLVYRGIQNASISMLSILAQ